MKLTTIFLFLTVMAMAANTFSQGTKFNLNVKDATIIQVFDEIERITEFGFLFKTDQLDLNKHYTLDIKDSKIENILQQLLSQDEYSYKFIDRNIVITRNNSNSVSEQQKSISGKVTDSSALPLPGVSVVVKGTTNGTITDADGKYAISNVPATATLQFSFVGMKTQEIAVGGKPTINVILAEDAIDIEEVVAIGYGVQKKVNLTGSVTSISGNELKETPTANISNAIAGRMAGVFARNSNGTPGSGSTLNIRGLNTLGNNSPLIVVDNIPRSDFSVFDAQEIESITILKDAAATAVYGARANNGVFLITTKKGNSGKPTITYTGSMGVQTPTNYPELMTPYQYATTRNQGYRNRGYDPANPSQSGFFFKDSDIQLFKDGKAGTDWYDATFQKNAKVNNHNVTLNGGSEMIKYFLSMGYVDQDGMYESIGYKAYKFRSNIEAKITNSLKMEIGLDGQQQNFARPGWDANSIFGHVIRANPTNMSYYPSGRPFNTAGEHPVEEVKSSGYNRSLNNSFQGTIGLTQQLAFITKGLSATARASFGKQYIFDKSFFLPYTMYNEDATGNVTGTKVVGGQTSLTQTFNHSYSKFYNVSLNYQRTFGKHDVNALALYEQSENLGDKFTGYKKDFAINSKDEFYVSGSQNETLSGSSYISDARKALVGRIAYAYNDKYLLESSFRYDGSYIFPEGKRFGLFPSVSAGWRISEEPFIKNNSRLAFINNLKIRASRGLIGNDRVNPFQFQDAYSLVTNGGPFFDSTPSPSVFAGVYPNLDITWEKSLNTNIGFDANLWNGLLGVEFDYFTKVTKDILWSRVRSVPATFGRSLPNENYAEVENKGFELVLSHQGIIANSVKYNMRFMGSYATNKVTKIDDPVGALDYQKQLGKSIGYRVGYKSLGLFQSLDEAKAWMGGNQFGQATIAGDIKYADINDDKVIDSKDQILLSNNTSTPKVILGLSGSLKWRAFDFNFLIQGAAAANVLISGTARNMFNGGGSSNAFAYLTDSWSETNKNAKYPIAWVDSRSINDRTSNFWLKDAPYARLKSLDLGYTFQKSTLKNLPIDNARIFISGSNLFTWSKFKEFDPEVESGAGSYYPQQRVVSVGVNVSF